MRLNSPRKQCSDCGIHTKIFAGISGSKVDGAYSIVVSGHYTDDYDHGYTLMYTGTGGRAKFNEAGKRTMFGKQIEDQTLEHPHNQALFVSFRNNTPIRVIRGAKSKSNYAPWTGYRYDGLYVIDDFNMEVGKAGFQVCKFALRTPSNESDSKDAGPTSDISSPSQIPSEPLPPSTESASTSTIGGSLADIGSPAIPSAQANDDEMDN
ncbi:hypothetical protein QCA50_006310 [Cerrena zonata]|uniref:YDG domain-containing protein n=1 Tax=Cerrena zonata TaxID=2478898 RepID=A0AAW0GF82_9APHY